MNAGIGEDMTSKKKTEPCRDERCRRFGVHGKHKIYGTGKGGVIYPAVKRRSERRVTAAEKVRRILGRADDPLQTKDIVRIYAESYETVTERTIYRALDALIASGIVARLGLKFSGSRYILGEQHGVVLRAAV